MCPESSEISLRTGIDLRENSKSWHLDSDQGHFREKWTYGHPGRVVNEWFRGEAMIQYH